MKIGLIGVTMVGFLCMTTSVLAEPVTQDNVDKAQVKMLTRAMDAVDKYSERINIDHEFVIYCRADLSFKKGLHPRDGSIPFGVNYKKITDSDFLDTVLLIRENYERSFVILCLANAKNALREAAKP